MKSVACIMHVWGKSRDSTCPALWYDMSCIPQLCHNIRESDSNACIVNYNVNHIQLVIMLENILTAATGRMLQLALFLKQTATVIFCANFMVIVVMMPYI